MAVKRAKSRQELLQSEIGAIRKQWKGRIRIALVYPNRYHVGMSSLGYQTLYALLNELEQVVCERAFLPDDKGLKTVRPATLESGRSIAEADVIAFSISFENASNALPCEKS